MSERLNKTIVWMYYLAGVVSSLIIVFSFVLYTMPAPGPQLSATIRSFPWELPTSEIDKDYAEQLTDIKSMYIIEVRNIGDMEAKNILAHVPEAKIVEVVLRGEKKRVPIDNIIIHCGDLTPSSILYVTVWSTNLPVKENAEKVRIFSESAHVRAKVEATKGTFARIIDRTIIVVFAVSLAALIITLLWWRKNQRERFKQSILIQKELAGLQKISG